MGEQVGGKAAWDGVLTPQGRWKQHVEGAFLPSGAEGVKKKAAGLLSGQKGAEP